MRRARASVPAVIRDTSFDSTFAFLREPYEFISKRCSRYGTDVFETRLLLQPAICVLGADAAELICDNTRFQRHGAMPHRVRATLLGEGGVQGLDDDEHRHRKAMFMSLMTPARIADMRQITVELLEQAGAAWEEAGEVVLYEAIQPVLTRAACAWAGVRIPESEVGERSAELTAMFHDAGAVGPAHWRSRSARRHAEDWIRQVIMDIRSATHESDPDGAAHVIALHRDLAGELLPPQVAAVELLNILRPIVAVAVFITFAAHALAEFPECRSRLTGGEDGYTEQFVQEVRRFYPFFPAVAARVRGTFEWQGHVFPKGRRVLLDLYGTNHDPRIWDRPMEFRPERFRDASPSEFAFIPQGPGDHFLNHRCPGEAITVELMKTVVEFLTTRLAYGVPQQDLTVDMSRLPALPRSRFVIDNIDLLD
jgi:fatty-acid peroxygenase